MDGLVFVNSSAQVDYSGSGLGNIDWKVNYFTKGGITDPTQKQAYLDFYNGLVTDDLWSRMLGLCLFPGSTASTQKHQFMPGVPEIEFIGSTLHSSSGFSPNGAWAKTNFDLVDMPNLAIGVYNNSAEELPGSGYACMAGCATSNALAQLGRYINGSKTGGGWASAAPGGVETGRDGYAINRTYTNTGLVVARKNGTQFVYTDNTTGIGNFTFTAYNPILAGGNYLLLGAGSEASNKVSKARQACAFWATFTSTAQVTSFHSRLVTLLTALGRT